jgi:hypothetical protein
VHSSAEHLSCSRVTRDRRPPSSSSRTVATLPDPMPSSLPIHPFAPSLAYHTSLLTPHLCLASCPSPTVTHTWHLSLVCHLSVQTTYQRASVRLMYGFSSSSDSSASYICFSRILSAFHALTPIASSSTSPKGTPTSFDNFPPPPIESSRHRLLATRRRHAHLYGASCRVSLAVSIGDSYARYRQA